VYKRQVTGAARGLGRQTAVLFAEEGANVFMTDVRAKELEELDNKLKNSGYDVESMIFDIADITNIKKMIGSAILKYGNINILVNCAGVSIAKKMMDITESDWDMVLSINVKGTYFVMIEVARLMIENGIKGSIINIASIAGEKSRPNFASYAASKASVINFTRSAAQEFSRYCIRVNAVSPGTIDTPMWEEIAENVAEIEGLSKSGLKKKWVDRIPLKRLAKPQDISNTVLFLCSEKASYITGQVINVCGGLSIV
jgi:NAD(P)-dependent dehydrogenase (short-subunit alcohol dehydrogenase family)